MPTKPPNGPPNASQHAAPALIVGLILLAYWNAFAGGFQFDNVNLIIDNPAVASQLACTGTAR